MITIDLTDSEASFFIAMREAKLFDLKNTDVIFHVNSDGVLIDIKQIIKEKLICIYSKDSKAGKRLTPCQ